MLFMRSGFFRVKVEPNQPFKLVFTRSDGLEVTHRDALRLTLDKETGVMECGNNERYVFFTVAYNFCTSL